MKKLLLSILVVCGIIIGVLLVRASTYFTDKQVTVSAPLQPALINEADAIDRFARSLQFATISHEQADSIDGEAFIGFRQHLEASFSQVHQVAERKIFNDYSLLYHFPGTDPNLKPVLFMGHMDVVPVDEATRDEWQQPPFSGAVVDNVVWGRGAIDDKVTVLALMEAMEHLLTQQTPLQRSVYFAFGHDEEIGGLQGAAVIAEHFRQQGTEFEFVLDEGGAITQGLMAGIDDPVAVIGVAEKGYVNMRLSVRDKGGHSSQPPPHTAVGILSQAVVDVEAHPFEADLTFINMTFDKVGYYAPFATRLAMANQWLLSSVVKSTLSATPSSAAGIRTTTAATMMQGSSKSNILPTLAEGVVNFRILPGDSIDTVHQHVTRAINNDRVQVTPYMGNEPSPVSAMDSLGYRLIEHTIRSMDDSILVAPYLVQGGTDAKHFFGLSDSVYRFMMVRLTPETLPRFHGVNEQIPAQDYLQAVQFKIAMLNATVSGQPL